jgi:hypothetical protein
VLTPRGNAATSAEILYACGLKRLFVSRSFDFAQGIIAKLFEWMAHDYELKVLQELHRYKDGHESDVTFVTFINLVTPPYAAFLLFFSCALFA